MRTVGWEGRSIRAAGRTDAGVHAHGQVISYQLDWRHPPERLSAALNSLLPRDVAVRQTEPTSTDFDPRFSASGRRYSYRVLSEPAPDPFAERYAWRIWPGLDEPCLAELAQLFIGRRDFGAFGQAPIPGGHSIREIRQAGWLRQDGQLVFRITADAFLHRMVRRIVGSMIEICAGGADRRRLESALDDPAQFWNGRVAPARGLFLEKVEYKERRDEVAKNLLSET